MPVGDGRETTDLAAGDFSSWLAGMQEALKGDRASDVPCDGCTACCTSSQFVHVGPEETDTLAHVPPELLFPAPGLPPGHRVLGYDERGHCPMLVDDRCSIYEHRPRTCRTYDCRIFPAVGVEPDAKVRISQRARRWRFAYAGEADRARHEAVRAASAFLRRSPGRLPPGAVPRDPVQLAVLAVEIHHLFVRHDGKTDRTEVMEPDPDAVGELILRLRPREQDGATRPSRRSGR